MIPRVATNTHACELTSRFNDWSSPTTTTARTIRSETHLVSRAGWLVGASMLYPVFLFGQVAGGACHPH